MRLYIGNKNYSSWSMRVHVLMTCPMSIETSLPQIGACTLADDASGYVQRLCSEPAVARWIADAHAEREFLAFAEPYRTRPADR